MKRGLQLILVVGACLSGVASAQEEKKSEKKDDILGKPIGEWIRILREHEKSNYREAALLALEAGGAAKGTGLAAILEAAEKDQEPVVRRKAVVLIGKLGPGSRGTLKTLIAVLQDDKTESVRETAAVTIGSSFTDIKQGCPAQAYLTVLIDALEDPHAGTRLAVATTLRQMGSLAESAVPALLEVAKNKTEQPLARVVAIHVISRQGKTNAQTWPLIVTLLAEEQPAEVRDAAAEALGRSASDAAEVIGVLEKTLTEKNVELRKTAAISLSALGAKAKAAWPTVKTRVTAEPNNSIRNHLIRLTGVLGKEKTDAIPVLEERAVKDDATENRIAAIQELGELGPLAKSAIPALTRLSTQDARAAIRDEAATAVKRISPK